MRTINLIPLSFRYADLHLAKMDSNSNGDIPQDLLDAAAAVEKELLPDKSGDRYKSAFELLMSWLKSINTPSFAEPVLLAYFQELF